MIRRSIPSTGEAIGAVGLGTWQVFDVGATAAERRLLEGVVQELFRGGGSLVDTSPMYGRAEAVAGELLAQSGAQPFIATKVWTTGRAQGIAEMERSMRLLRSARIDLMQVHNPVDWRTHLDTLAGWKAEGRIRYTGITHYTASAHEELCAVMRTARPDFVQVNYALDDRTAETGVLPLARQLGIAVLVNRPFGEGRLLARLKQRPLPPVAGSLGATSWAQLALKFILANEAVTCVIPATSNPANMRANALAAGGPLPDARQRAAILQAAGL